MASQMLVVMSLRLKIIPSMIFQTAKLLKEKEEKLLSNQVVFDDASIC